MADDKQYKINMNRTNKLIKGIVVYQWGRYSVELSSEYKLGINNTLRITNKIEGLIFQGDIVEGYIFESNYTTHDYAFYITRNITRSINKEEFINLVNHIAVDRINNEISLFDKPKRMIEYDKLTQKTRYREYVICRYMAINVILEILNGQVNDEYLAHMYHMDRCTVIHARKELDKYGFATQLKNILDDIRAEAIKLYESLKQPQNIEVFEFIEQ